MKDTTLIVLAAWMGNRYGGLKQIDSFWPTGETIIDYSVYDAIAAGFTKIVYVIRESFEEQFREKVIQKLPTSVQVEIVFQPLEIERDWIDFPPRQKPRWVVHALVECIWVVHEPFAVINADDYYGRSGYATMIEFLQNFVHENAGALVGYDLLQTVSSHGTVNRWLCEVKHKKLLAVEEWYGIHREWVSLVDKNGVLVPQKKLASMNFRWFHHSFLEKAAIHFEKFIEKNSSNPTAEYVIPDVVDELIKNDMYDCHVLATPDKWVWVTNPEDKKSVVDTFVTLIKDWVYTSPLWK